TAIAVSCADRLAQNRQSLDGVGAHRRVNRGHEQRRGNSLSTYIADGENHARRIPGQEVVVVAADGPCRGAETVHLKRRQLRNLPRKELCLHLLRDGQFVLQPLLFLLLLYQLFQRSGHRVEGLRQGGELIGRLYRDAVAEISAIDVLRGRVE